MELLQRYRLDAIVVVNDEDKLEGIVTHSDIMGKLLPSQQELMENQHYMTDPDSLEDRIIDILNIPIKVIMATDVKTIDPESRAIQAGALMKAYKVRRLPVVENDKVVGIINYSDIAWGFTDKYFEYVPKKR